MTEKKTTTTEVVKEWNTCLKIHGLLGLLLFIMATIHFFRMSFCIWAFVWYFAASYLIGRFVKGINFQFRTERATVKETNDTTLSYHMKVG